VRSLAYRTCRLFVSFELKLNITGMLEVKKVVAVVGNVFSGLK